jgi:hypothetical protein
MKRKIAIVGFVLICAASLILLFVSKSDSNAPRFVSAAPGFKIGAPNQLAYNFLLPSPYEAGLLWISTFDRKGVPRTYLYDIEQKKVLGELTNGWPSFGNRDQSKVLLTGHSASLKEKFFQLIDRITGGKLKLANRMQEESFEVFDRKKNRSVPVGRVYQFIGTGSRWYPSPTFRYGYTRPTGSPETDVYLCDLEKSRMTKIIIHGYPVGWWNESAILYKSDHYDLTLYDVVKNQSSILLSADKIKEFCRQNQLSDDPTNNQVAPFPTWDGQQYQFYFTHNHKRWEATNSFLAKIERPSGKLKLIAADFKFEWSDSFDPTGRYYVYSGREFSDGDKVSAVYVRDLQTGETRTLAEDSGINRHSIPHWYGNGAIYSRSNMLWQIKLSETNATRVFPPPGE